MKKFLIFMFILVLCAFSASANVNWFTWGNYDYQGSGVGVDDVLWASNYPQGSLNFSNSSFSSVTSVLVPSVIDVLNNNPYLLTSDNEIFIFTINKIYIYDSDFNYVSSLTLDNNIKGKGCFFNYNSDSYIDFAIMDGANLKVFQLNGNELATTYTKNLGAAYSNVECALSPQGYQKVFAWGTNNVVKVVNVATDSVTTFSSVGWINGQLCGSPLNNFYNPITSGDFDKDTNIDVAWVINDGASDQFLYMMNLNTETLMVNGTALDTDLSDPDGCDIAYGNIGSSSSVKELLYSKYKSGANNKIGTAKIFDNGIAVKYTTPINYNISNWMVYDINYDGLNEACLRLSNNISCFNSLGINEYNFELPAPNDFKYISGGEYDGVNSWQEILTPDGIFNITTAAYSNLTKILELGETDRNAFLYTTKLKQKASFSKDILLAKSSAISALYSGGTSSICGNAVCEAGETILTCPADCGITSTNDALMGIVTVNPGTSLAWKNGTDVAVTVQALSKSSANGGARAVLYFGTTYAMDSGISYGGINQTYSFLFKANQTIPSAYLKVFAYSQQDNSSDTLTIGFSVQENGATYGSGTSTFNQPVTPATSGAVNTDTNAIKSGINSISPTQFGLGYLGIWLILMLIVGITILYAASQNHWDGNITFSFVALFEIVMVILGTALGFIPLGVIITIVIIGLGIGALVWRKSATGG